MLQSPFYRLPESFLISDERDREGLREYITYAEIYHPFACAFVSLSSHRNYWDAGEPGIVAKGSCNGRQSFRVKCNRRARGLVGPEAPYPLRYVLPGRRILCSFPSE